MRLLVRMGGWLLTPLLAWAASFLGAVLGSLLGSNVGNPYVGIALTAAAGLLAGGLTILLWLRLLRRSPSIQQALQVRADGTPLELPLDEDATTPSAPRGPA